MVQETLKIEQKWCIIFNNHRRNGYECFLESNTTRKGLSMNFKKLFRRVISLLIISVMLISVASPIISAAGNIEKLHKDNADDGKLHYVSLGASNTNGYGHHGYLDDDIYEDPLAAPKAEMNDYGYDKSPANAYPALIKDALANATGREVELHQLAISSMRVEEVLWLLDDTYEPDEYMDWRFTGGKSWFDMAHKEGGREALRVEYRDYIANADVITVDLGWNNFGVYAFNNIMTILKEDGRRYWKAPDFDSVIGSGKAEEYYAIRDKVIERLNEAVDLSDTSFSNDVIQKLADVLAYAMFGACYNFDRVIDKIYALNPDANVVVINIQNLADELIVNLDGIELPLGDIYGELIETVEIYRASRSPYADKYDYAYAGEDGDVDTFLDEFRLWDGDPATLSQDMKDLFDMYDDNLYVRSKIEYIMVGQVLGALFQTFRNMGASYGLPVFQNDGNYTYEFAFDMAWLDGVDLAALDFNNPDTPLEEYGAAVSKHLVNLRDYEGEGKNAYNYVFENVTQALTLQKTQVQIQKSNAEVERAGLVAQRDTLIEEKAVLEAQLGATSDPASIAELQTAIATYEGYIAQYNDGIAQYDDGIAEATAGISQLENAINTIIPVAKQGFDNTYAGIYQTYINTLNYAYDTVGTIVQYTLQFNTFYITPDSMANHNNKTNELLAYIVNTFTNNTMLKFYEELGKIGLDSSGAVAPEITVNEALFEDPLIQAVCALEVRYDFGNSFFAHPSVKGNQQIRDAVMDALTNGSHASKFLAKKAGQYLDLIEGILNSYYEDAYAELKANGTIDQILGGLDEIDAAMDTAETEVINYQIPDDIDGERAENIRVLLLEEFDNVRGTTAELRILLGTESIEFNSENYEKLVRLYNNLEDHVNTIGALASELGCVADTYLAELTSVISHHIGIVNDMANGAYDYLMNEAEAINEGYLEFVELVGSYADVIDPVLGKAVRDYLIDTPKDAIMIICQYGDDAILKLIADAAGVVDDLGASFGAIIAILGEHGEEILKEIESDPEYKALADAIEEKAKNLIAIYNEAKANPVLTALDIDKIIAKEVVELEELYVQLVDLVIKNVKAYDEEVAEILWTALTDMASELGIISEAGDEYLAWLDGHTDAMLGALLHSFLQNTLELGEATDSVIWKYLNNLKDCVEAYLNRLAEELRITVKELCSDLINYIKEYIKIKITASGILDFDINFDFIYDIPNLIAAELLNLATKFSEEIFEILNNAVNGEYTPDENSYYVAITGNSGEYADLLALAMGIGDRYSVMGWDNIDKDALNKADFVTLGYDRTQISGFAVEQFLAAVAEYGSNSLREQVADYINEALSDDMSPESVAEFHKNIDDAIVSALERPELAGKEVVDIDWSKLVGEENLDIIEKVLAEIEEQLNEKGIDGDYVLSVNVVELLDKYLPDEGASIEIFDNKPVFELTIPVADMVMLGIESYIYANIMFHIEYAETIVGLLENNPDVKIAVLGQYNPFKDITIADIEIPLSEIYENVVAVSNINSFVYALTLSGVTYVDISDVQTSWNNIEDPYEFLSAYLSNPEGEAFTGESNLYVMKQIMDAYGLECKHYYEDCDDMICNLCGNIRDQLGHNYGSVVTEPDCVNGGYTTHTCSICGKTYVDNKVDALGHTYDHACDDDCNRCGEKRTPADHQFGDWVVVVEPTKESEGREERECSICGHKESRSIAYVDDTVEEPKQEDEKTLGILEIIAIVCGTAIIAFGVAASIVLIFKKRKQE